MPDKKQRNSWEWVDGYSQPFYKPETWDAIGNWLYETYPKEAVEEILRSKYMRWFRDVTYKPANCKWHVSLRRFKLLFNEDKAEIDQMLRDEFGFTIPMRDCLSAERMEGQPSPWT